MSPYKYYNKEDVLLNIQAVVKNDKVCGYLLVDEGIETAVSVSYTKIKEVADLLKEEGYKYTARGIVNSDGSDLEAVDFESLEESKQFNLSIEHEVDTIEIDEEIYVEKEYQENLLSKGKAIAIKNREAFLKLLNAPRLANEDVSSMHLNELVDYDCLFSRNEMVGKIKFEIDKFQKFTVADWTKLLLRLKNDGLIDENSSWVEIYKAYYKMGYPGLKDVIVESSVVPLERLGYEDDTSEEVVLVDASTNESLYPATGMSLTRFRQIEKDPDKDNELNIAYSSRVSNSRAISMTGKYYNYVVRPNRVEVISKTYQNDKTVLVNPIIEITRGFIVPAEYVNLLNKENTKQVSTLLASYLITQSVADFCRPRDMKSTWSILDQCPISTYSKIKFLFKRDLEGEVKNKTELASQVNERLSLIDAVLNVATTDRETGLLTLSDENADSIPPLKVVSELDGEESYITAEDIIQSVNDFQSGVINFDNTLVANSTAMAANIYAVRDFVKASNKYLGKSIQEVVKELYKLKDLNDGIVDIGLTSEKGEYLKARIDKDPDRVKVQNLKDYVEYTSLDNANTWMYVTTAFKGYGTDKHVAVEYLAWQHMNNGKPNIKNTRLETHIKDEVTRLIMESKSEQARKVRGDAQLFYRLTNKITANVIFGIKLGKIGYKRFAGEDGTRIYAVLDYKSGDLFEGNITVVEGVVRDIIKNVEQYTDTTGFILDTSVGASSMSKVLVNCRYNNDKFIPNKGSNIAIAEFVATVMNDKVDLSYIKLFNDRGLMKHPITNALIVDAYSRNSMSAMRGRAYVLSEYAAYVKEYLMSVAKKKAEGFRPNRPLTPQEMTYACNRDEGFQEWIPMLNSDEFKKLEMFQPSVRSYSDEDKLKFIGINTDYLSDEAGKFSEVPMDLLVNNLNDVIKLFITANDVVSYSYAGEYVTKDRKVIKSDEDSPDFFIDYKGRKVYKGVSGVFIKE